MCFRIIRVCGVACFVGSVACAAIGAEEGDITPIEAWTGEIGMSGDANVKRALQQVASIRLVNDPETWAFVWQTIMGKDSAVPDVNFQKNLVFVRLMAQTREPKVRLLHDGRGNAGALVVTEASAFNAGYAMLVFPRGGLTTFNLQPIPKPRRVAVAKPRRPMPDDSRQKEVVAPYRTWTSADGKFTVDARFLKFDSGCVFLERKDTGATVAVPSSQVSQDDRDYVRAFLQSQRSGGQ